MLNTTHENKAKSIAILVVEDNLGDCRLLEEILDEDDSFNHRLIHAPSLAKGLEYTKMINFDIVLLDLILPDSAGLQTLIRLYDNAPNVPIIALSGIDDRQVALQAVQEGAQDYLVKGSFDNDILGRAILYAIERKRILFDFRHKLMEMENVKEIEASKRERFHTLLQNSNNCVVIRDKQKIIHFANKQAENLLGKSAEELIGTELDEVSLTSNELTNIHTKSGASKQVTTRTIETEWDGRLAYLTYISEVKQHSKG